MTVVARHHIVLTRQTGTPLNRDAPLADTRAYGQRYILTAVNLDDLFLEPANQNYHLKKLDANVRGDIGRLGVTKA
ncbi:MAG: hypothetical protein WBV23_04710 [Desulfobaccales bacterium]